jgi:hypothetical protein
MGTAMEAAMMVGLAQIVVGLEAAAVVVQVVTTMNLVVADQGAVA